MTDDGQWDPPTEYDDRHAPLAGAGLEDDGAVDVDDVSGEDPGTVEQRARAPHVALDGDDFSGEDPVTIRGTAEQRARARQIAVASRLAGTTEPVRRVTAQGASVEPREPAAADVDDASGSRITARAAVAGPRPGDASATSARTKRSTAQGAAAEPREPAPPDPEDGSGKRITARRSAVSVDRSALEASVVEPGEADFSTTSGAPQAPRTTAPTPPASLELATSPFERAPDRTSTPSEPTSEPARRRSPTSEPTSAHAPMVVAQRSKRPSDESTAAASPIALAPRTKRPSDEPTGGAPAIIARARRPSTERTADSPPLDLLGRPSDPAIAALPDPPRANMLGDPPHGRDSRPMPRAGTRPPQPRADSNDDRPSDPTIVADLDMSGLRGGLVPHLSRLEDETMVDAGDARSDSQSTRSSRASTAPPPNRPRTSVPVRAATPTPPASHHEVSTTLGSGEDGLRASRLPLRAPATPDPDEAPVDLRGTLRGTEAARAASSRPPTSSPAGGPERPITGRNRALRVETGAEASDVAPLSTLPRAKTPPSGMRSLGTPASGLQASRRHATSAPADPVVAVVADPAEHERVRRLAELAGIAIAIVDHTERAPALSRIVTLGQSWLPDLDPRVAYVARANIADEHLGALILAIAGGATAEPPADLTVPQSAAEARRAQIAVTGARAFATADDHATAEAAAIATIRELVDADRAYLLWFDAATSSLRSAIRGRDGRDDRRAIAGIAGWAARTGRAARAEHESADPRWLGPIDDPDGDSHGPLAIQPVVEANGRVRAVLVAARRPRRPGFTDVETALLARFAALVGPLVDPLALHVETRSLLAASATPVASAPRTLQRVRSRLAALPPWALVACAIALVVLVLLLV